MRANGCERWINELIDAGYLKQGGYGFDLLSEMIQMRTVGQGRDFVNVWLKSGSGASWLRQVRGGVLLRIALSECY